LEPINYNGRILTILKGETAPQLPLPMPWVTADDCAFVCIAAITKGARGERYIAHGPDGKGATVAEVGNLACELAGLPQRVHQIGLDELDSPEVLAKFGPTSPLLAKNAVNAKGTDSTFTQQKLGYKPTPLKEGLSATLDWMRSVKAL
jgi:nucleoside-diphosphate-sugar epimerase